jgi:hypothetical protein
MWGQVEDPPDGAVVDEPLGTAPSGGAPVGAPLGGDSPDAVDGADEEPVEDGVVVAVVLVAAPATAAPPATRPAARATPARVCRSRIFIRFTSCIRLSGAGSTVDLLPERALATPWQFLEKLEVGEQARKQPVSRSPILPLTGRSPVRYT